MNSTTVFNQTQDTCTKIAYCKKEMTWFEWNSFDFASKSVEEINDKYNQVKANELVTEYDQTLADYDLFTHTGVSLHND